MARVSINIVTWNNLKFLPDALESIYSQTYRDFVVLIVDNASSDGTVEFVRENYPQAVILRNTRNLGFTRAHNQGFTYAQAHLKPESGDPLVLVTNPDIILEKDFLGNLVSGIDRCPSAGSASGRILRAREEQDFGMRQVIRTDVIDTTGLRPFRSGRFVDRGSGQTDDGNMYRTPEEIFGVSGCVALYRLQALSDVAYADGSVYDEDYFMYKEDVDLAWRLRLLGWSSAYVPDAVAYHFRTAAGAERSGVLQVIRGRHGRSSMINRLSARNHLITLIKNVQLNNLFRHLPMIFGYELKKAVYSLLFEPKTFLAGLSVLPQLPGIFRKRGQVMRRVKVSAKDMRKWF